MTHNLNDTDAPVDGDWLRCKKPSLTDAQMETLQGLGLACDGWSMEQYYMFASRTFREYIALQKSPLHFNRMNVLRAAVAQVFHQIRPRDRLPHGGDKAVTAQVLLPVLAKVRNIEKDTFLTSKSSFA